MSTTNYAIVLAAGKGKRLIGEGGSIPKVMHLANGKPLLAYVLQNIDFVPPQNTVIVVGYQKETVMDGIGGGYQYAVQQEQLGTGHAVKSAADFFADKQDGDVLVCYGDSPLFCSDTFAGMLEVHAKTGADCTVLTAITEDKLPYGRIIRKEGKFADVIEEKDCTPEQRAINELNVGVYVFKVKLLFGALDRLRNNNAQGEYYLTDVPKLLLQEGCAIETFSITDPTECVGVNTPADLAFCEQVLSQREQRLK